MKKFKTNPRPQKLRTRSVFLVMIGLTLTQVALFGVSSPRGFLLLRDPNTLCSGRKWESCWCVCTHLHPQVGQRCHLCPQNNSSMLLCLHLTGTLWATQFASKVRAVCFIQGQPHFTPKQLFFLLHSRGWGVFTAVIFTALSLLCARSCTAA